MKNHDISVCAMIDAEDDLRIGLSGRDAEQQFVRLSGAYNEMKAERDQLAADRRELMEALENIIDIENSAMNLDEDSDEYDNEILRISNKHKSSINSIRTTLDKIKAREEGQ